MALITVLIVGAGALALSGVSLSVGYLFLLLFIALVLAFIGTYLVSNDCQRRALNKVLGRKRRESDTDVLKEIFALFRLITTS